MFQANLGDNSSACPQVTSLAVPPGATVTVANLTGSTGTVSYYTDANSSAAAGTIAPGANQSFTTPTWLTSAGISSVQITGAGY